MRLLLDYHHNAPKTRVADPVRPRFLNHEDHSAAKPQPKPRCDEDPVFSGDTTALRFLPTTKISAVVSRKIHARRVPSCPSWASWFDDVARSQSPDSAASGLNVFMTFCMPSAANISAASAARPMNVSSSA